jgi:hypothetical protein
MHAWSVPARCPCEIGLPMGVVARIAGVLVEWLRMILGWLVVPIRCRSGRREDGQPMRTLQYQRRFVIAVVVPSQLPAATQAWQPLTISSLLLTRT